MRNSKLGGERLLKKEHIEKEHIKKESLCQRCSLLLSLCMAASLFGSVASFSVLAREVGQAESKVAVKQAEPKKETAHAEAKGGVGRTKSKEETRQTGLEEETWEEIRARLLRQVKEEGWDPYSADMSVDEFYALMELFQEGILPMEEGNLVVEVSETRPDFDEPDDERPDASPFRKWIEQHPTYTFWDAVNNATDGTYYDKTDFAHADRESEAYKNLTDDEKSEEEKIRDALDVYFSGMGIERNRQKEYDSVLQALLNKDKGGSQEVDDFSRNGDYTFTVWEDKGVIPIWMYESDPDLLDDTEPTISNASGLPQTGQLWWPVFLLAAVGVPLFMIGTALSARKEEAEEFEEPYE